MMIEHTTTNWFMMPSSGLGILGTNTMLENPPATYCRWFTYGVIFRAAAKYYLQTFITYYAYVMAKVMVMSFVLCLCHHAICEEIDCQ